MGAHDVTALRAGVGVKYRVAGGTAEFHQQLQNVGWQDVRILAEIASHFQGSRDRDVPSTSRTFHQAAGGFGRGLKGGAAMDAIEMDSGHEREKRENGSEKEPPIKLDCAKLTAH
jgi:hypothetical protein